MRGTRKVTLTSNKRREGRIVLIGTLNQECIGKLFREGQNEEGGGGQGSGSGRILGEKVNRNCEGPSPLLCTPTHLMCNISKAKVIDMLSQAMIT